MMLGVGLDSDGHKRVTKGDNFALVGGLKETHEEMTEKAVKINEKLNERSKHLTMSVGKSSTTSPTMWACTGLIPSRINPAYVFQRSPFQY